MVVSRQWWSATGTLAGAGPTGQIAAVRSHLPQVPSVLYHVHNCTTLSKHVWVECVCCCCVCQCTGRSVCTAAVLSFATCAPVMGPVPFSHCLYGMRLFGARSVDLGASYAIGTIVIYNRGDCCGQNFQNVEIRVGPGPVVPGGTDPRRTGNALCAFLPGPSTTGAVMAVQCVTAMAGRWVSLQAVDTITQVRGAEGVCGWLGGWTHRGRPCLARMVPERYGSSGRSDSHAHRAGRSALQVALPLRWTLCNANANVTQP